MQEAPKFGLGITQKTVDRSPNHVFPFSEYPLSYVHIVEEKMIKEQNNLSKYLHFIIIHDLITNKAFFATAAALTYEKIPESHRLEPLTLDQVLVAHKSISEHYTENPETSRVTYTFELSWFRNKLQNDSPPFVDWFDKMLDGIENDQDRANFSLGVISVAMPFLMRAEARGMEQKLFSH